MTNRIAFSLQSTNASRKASPIAATKVSLGLILLICFQLDGHCQRIHQESTGSQSPNISHTQGDVNIEYQSDAKSRGQYEIPNVQEKPYHIARQILIDKGWMPSSQYYVHHGDLSGNGPVFWEKGYWEVVSCSGTGFAFCRFEFEDPSGRVLAVITAGEEETDGSSHASVNKVFIVDEADR